MEEQTIETLDCFRCGGVFPYTHFAIKKSKRGRNSWCKTCQRGYVKEHYAANKEKYLERVATWVKANPEKRKKNSAESSNQRQRQDKLMAVEYKGGKCVDCNIEYPMCCYDFHHLDPTVKEFSPAQLLNSKGFEMAQEELDKCVLLCSNCHRIRHSAFD